MCLSVYTLCASVYTVCVFVCILCVPLWVYWVSLCGFCLYARCALVWDMLSFMFTSNLGLELPWDLGVGSVEFQPIHWQAWAGRC